MKYIPTMFCAVGAILFVGCSGTQTTSGSEYLKGYAAPPKSELDKEVYDTANVDPNLKFPARIGLARIDAGSMTAIPSDESNEWEKLSKELGVEYGEFIPVSRLIAAMVTEPSGSENKYNRSSEEHLREIIRTVRLGAARQHLDLVLLYEVYGAGESYLTPAAITNLTIIGAFIMPGREIKAKGHATAILLDVRNGYPYGTASATVDDKTFSTSINSYENQLSLTDKTKICAAVNLVPDVKTMFTKLAEELKSKQK